MDDETLLNQLKVDLKELFNQYDEYKDMLVKNAFEEYPELSYPAIVIEELENSDNERYYDGYEHIVNVGYQFYIYAGQSETLDAESNVRYIIDIIKHYMRGERYHALKRTGGTPITKKQDDENIKIGFMRYTGCIDIDTNTIYRRK